MVATGKTIIRQTIIVFLFTAASIIPLAAQVDWSGYFESEGDYIQTDHQKMGFGYNKLRLDFSADATENIHIGGDLVARFYWGKTTWNLADFLPPTLIPISVINMPTNIPYTIPDTLFIDNLFLDGYAGKLHYTLGRQQISPGVAYAWNPTDIFNKKDVMDPTYEQSGVDALSLEIPLGGSLLFTGILQPDNDWNGSTRYLRGKLSTGAFDLGLSYGRYLLEFHHIQPPILEFASAITSNSREMLGLSFSGELAGIGMWSEIARTYSHIESYLYNCYSDESLFWIDPDRYDNGIYWQYVAGIDYTTDNSVYILAEYLHNDFGAKKDALTMNHYIDYLSGQMISLNRNYLFTTVMFPWGDSVTAGFFAISNLDDQSAAVNPQFQFTLSNNLELTMMVSAGFGETDSEMAQQQLGGRLRLRAWF